MFTMHSQSWHAGWGPVKFCLLYAETTPSFGTPQIKHKHIHVTLWCDSSLCTLGREQWQRYNYLHWTSGQQKENQGSSVFGLFTIFVQTTMHLSPPPQKSALDLVHTLLGVSHSWWASEIAWFFSRWRWAGPNPLTRLSGVARLWGLCRVQQANCGGPGSFIFPSS